MKTAFSYLNNRIAPVFDTAENICLLENNTVRTQIKLNAGTAAGKAAELKQLGICTLVCGAISREIENLISAQGIRIISFVAGELETTIGAWLTKQIGRAGKMPGCCRRAQGNGVSRRHCGPHGQTAQHCYCVCPECGRREPHRMGQPCATRQCGNCGAFMKKE